MIFVLKCVYLLGFRPTVIFVMSSLASFRRTRAVALRLPYHLAAFYYSNAGDNQASAVGSKTSGDVLLSPGNFAMLKAISFMRASDGSHIHSSVYRMLCQPRSYSDYIKRSIPVDYLRCLGRIL